MKKIVILILAAGFLTSCYDPYRTDYNYTSVAFSTASGSASDPGTLGRTVVKGEGLQLEMGVFLSGVLENKQEHWAEFEIDPSLLNGTNYEMMPEDYYTLSDDSRFIISSGDHTGRVTIELDSTNFVNDSDATELHYAIPFRLTNTSVDTILSQQSTKILAIKYINKYEGFYNHTGSFTTYDSNGDQINSGNFENVITATTTMLDSVRTNGLINQRGEAYMMAIEASNPDNVTLEYFPDPTPPEVTNLAQNDATGLSTSFVSGWESLEAVRDGDACSTCDSPKYGNWSGNTLGTWQWLEYELPNFFAVERTDVYWWTDGGGLQPASDSYVSYIPAEEEEFVQVQNSQFDPTLDQFNEVEFSSPFVTDVIRINVMHSSQENGDQAVGVSEWRVFGLPAPVTPEQASIASLGTDGENSYDSSTSTFTLNYRVDFENGGYSIVESEMVWRNRIRDGVNEWRR